VPPPYSLTVEVDRLSYRDRYRAVTVADTPKGLPSLAGSAKVKVTVVVVEVVLLLSLTQHQKV
jgi:hypothetical protein